jgi:hypothetical protein
MPHRCLVQRIPGQAQALQQQRQTAGYDKHVCQSLLGWAMLQLVLWLCGFSYPQGHMQQVGVRVLLPSSGTFLHASRVCQRAGHVSVALRVA